MSDEFDQICLTIGTAISDINGECEFKNLSYAGAPQICRVLTSDKKGNILSNTYFYDDHSCELFVYIKFH